MTRYTLLLTVFYIFTLHAGDEIELTTPLIEDQHDTPAQATSALTLYATLQQPLAHENCAICIEPLLAPISSTNNLRQSLEILRCSHTFHHACIERAINTNPHCPTCRTRINAQRYSGLNGRHILCCFAAATCSATTILAALVITLHYTVQ